MKGAINITFAGLRLVAIALCGIFLVSCVVSPQRPAAQYSVSPQGPTEQAWPKPLKPWYGPMAVRIGMT